MNAYDIFEHLLNLQEPKVYKTIEVPDGLGDTKEKRVVDIDATRVVQRKADDIRKAFKAWIFKDLFAVKLLWSVTMSCSTVSVPVNSTAAHFLSR